MENIKKEYKLKVASTILCILFVFTGILYSCPTQKDSLRVPLNGKDDYEFMRRIGKTLKYTKLNPELNVRPSLDPQNLKGDIFATGTNAFSFLSASNETNLQLVGQDVRDELGIPTTTGESKGNRPLNRKYVSTCSLMGSRSGYSAVMDYAKKSASNFLLSPENIEEEITKARNDLLSFLQTQEEYVGQPDKIKRFTEESLSGFYKLKAWFSSLTREEIEEFMLYSKIPVIVIGDQSGERTASVSSSVSGEVGLERLNIRIIAVDQKNMVFIESLIKKNRIGDVKIISMEEINTYSGGFVDLLFAHAYGVQPDENRVLKHENYLIEEARMAKKSRELNYPLVHSGYLEKFVNPDFKHKNVDQKSLRIWLQVFEEEENLVIEDMQFFNAEQLGKSMPKKEAESFFVKYLDMAYPYTEYTESPCERKRTWSDWKEIFEAETGRKIYRDESVFGDNEIILRFNAEVTFLTSVYQ
jgi:hypothetical protein